MLFPLFIACQTVKCWNIFLRIFFSHWSPRVIAAPTSPFCARGRDIIMLSCEPSRPPSLRHKLSCSPLSCESKKRGATSNNWDKEDNLSKEKQNLVAWASSHHCCYAVVSHFEQAAVTVISSPCNNILLPRSSCTLPGTLEVHSNRPRTCQPQK